MLFGLGLFGANRCCVSFSLFYRMILSFVVCLGYLLPHRIWEDVSHPRLRSENFVDEPYKILSPCGNCRQMMSQYMPDSDVIINTELGLKKICVKELIPFAYVAP